MDPYLEDSVYWWGVHAKLIGGLHDALNRALPPGYFADIDEHVWLQAGDNEERMLLGKPDTFVTYSNGAQSRKKRGSAAVAVLEPTVRSVLPKGRRHKQKFVKIVAPDHATVVTVIEVLSPANKGSSRAQYLAKRDEYFGAQTNLVEIDLLRDGERMPMGRPSAPGGDYYIFVARAEEFPKACVWQFTVRDAIPPVPVPLKSADGDVVIELQRLFTQIYDLSRYAKRIDYSAPAVPPLRAMDAEWAADLLKSAARKRKK
jgi:hypothetical protein